MSIKCGYCALNRNDFRKDEPGHHVSSPWPVDSYILKLRFWINLANG